MKNARTIIRVLFLFLSLPLATLPLLADDIEECTATATDSSGNVEPWTCPNDWQRGLVSYINGSGDTLNASLINYIWPIQPSVPGLLIQYSGESETSASGEFVVTGGVGAGELMGTASGDYAAFPCGTGCQNTSVDESYYSNFVQPGPGLGYHEPIIYSFIFGVPFTLTLSDEMTFFGETGPFSGSGIEDVTTVLATLAVFDSDGNSVAGASITSVPESSSLMLLLTAAGALGLKMLWGRRTVGRKILRSYD